MPVLEQEPDVSSRSQQSFCIEERRLLRKFAEAVDELLLLHASHSTAVLGRDPSAERFESLIQSARDKKRRAKEAYLEHTQAHGCSPR